MTAQDIMEWATQQGYDGQRDMEMAQRLADAETRLAAAMAKLKAIRRECERVLPDHAKEHPCDRILAILDGTS